jgi:hypothetical protein
MFSKSLGRFYGLFCSCAVDTSLTIFIKSSVDFNDFLAHACTPRTSVGAIDCLAQEQETSL